MDKKQIFLYVKYALAIYGAYKAMKTVQAKGGIMPALGLKK
jgi:hypothetical protein